ncbi:DsbA family protein [Martelella limonii]|uniref:DsbA family protein n=1 Tax=Martelella limonii TaxID=1647649 RepID=UPI0015803D1C|nr:DsbA family protein [Martelella limonii]
MLDRRTLLTGLIGTGALTLLPLSSASADGPSPEEIFFDPAAPVLGNPDGDVTIVEYFDFQCGYCKRDYPMVRDVVEQDGNIRLVMKDWPVFGPVSAFAAQAVLGAAEIGDYERAIDALMLSKGRLSYERVDEILTEAGLNFEEIAASVKKNDARISALLDRNYRQAEALQFIGTPSFVIGRTIYPGVLDRPLLEEAVAKARAG